MSAQQWDEIARTRLVRVLGAARAEKLYREVLEQLGLPALRSAADLLAFGDALARQEGFVGPLGASLRMHAILRGARAPDER